MTKLYTGYQAPSTAHENVGYPSLEIGGCQSLELVSAHTLLPHSITLKVRCSPIYCTNNVMVSLSDYEVAPISPYLSRRALKQLDLWIEQEGHHCFSQGICKPLDRDPQWDILFKGTPFYSMQFDTVDHDISFGEVDELIPYGGFFDADPEKCTQLYFKARWDQNKIDLIVRSHASKSLKKLIETQTISVCLTHCGQPYKYTSVAYTLTQHQELFIDFVASF